MATESVRHALILWECLRLLRDAPGPLSSAQVVVEVGRRAAPTPYERERNRSGGSRWETSLHFHSGDAATVGWMTKRGGWAITEAGITALDMYQEPAELYAECQRLYREIDRRRKQAKQELGGFQEFIANALSIVEPGTWTSTQDLAELTGASGQEVADFLAKVDVPNAYRVLNADGSIQAEGMTHWSYRGVDLRQRLVNEGVEFNHEERASAEQHVTAEVLRERLNELAQPAGEQPATQRAWMVRGSSVEGHNLVPDWLAEGFVSLAASQLGRVDPDLAHDELKQAVERSYQHKSYAYQEQRLAEFDRFLRQMRPGHLVLATARGEVFIGEVTDEAYFTDSPGRRSNLRRPVRWYNVNDPLDLDGLRPPIPTLLQSQAHVVDLTAALDELAPLYRPYVEEAPLPEKRELAFRHVDQTLADELLIHHVGWLAELEELLWEHKQIVLYGPPGTGKTYIAQRLARHLTEDHAVTLVQFHPSYTYEDFFEGFRPKQGPGGTLAFERQPGPFRRLAEEAGDNRSTPYVLIVDEINRANLAKIFGELYFLLEYRDESISLQYSPEEEFTLPENVFVIGTMNTADRSIALVDMAMRRRFAFVELHPREEPVRGLLRRWLEKRTLPAEAADLLDELNRRIEDGSIEKRDYAVGPSYLMRPAIYRRPDGLERVWRTEIMPLLEELYFGTDFALQERYGLASLRAATQSTTPADTGA